jgi:hypothetical protein
VVIALGIVAWYAFRPERLVVNQTVNEAFPGGQASSAQALASGTFHSVLHPTQGRATVYRLADGSRVLRFTDFKTSNGPDVHVYMVAADDAKDHATVLHSGFIDLGVIKGTSATRITVSDPMWTCRNIAASPCGARDSASISELPH